MWFSSLYEVTAVRSQLQTLQVNGPQLCHRVTRNSNASRQLPWIYFEVTFIQICATGKFNPSVEFLNLIFESIVRTLLGTSNGHLHDV